MRENKRKHTYVRSYGDAPSVLREAGYHPAVFVKPGPRSLVPFRRSELAPIRVTSSTTNILKVLSESIDDVDRLVLVCDCSDLGRRCCSSRRLHQDFVLDHHEEQLSSCAYTTSETREAILRKAVRRQVIATVAALSVQPAGFVLREYVLPATFSPVSACLGDAHGPMNAVTLAAGPLALDEGGLKCDRSTTSSMYAKPTTAVGGAVSVSSAAALSLEGANVADSGPGEVSRRERNRTRTDASKVQVL